MSGKVVGWAFDQREELGPTVRYVLVAYADNADHSTGKCWPDRPEIIEKTGLSRASVYRAVGELKRAGLLSEGPDEKGRHSIWLRVPWSSHTETAESQGETGESHGERTASHGETGTNTKEPSVEPSENRAVFDHWREVFSKNGNTRLDSARRSKISARLKSFSTQQLCRAIDGAIQDPWITGEHPESSGYGLTTILRDDDQVERFMALAEREKPRPRRSVH